MIDVNKVTVVAEQSATAFTQNVNGHLKGGYVLLYVEIDNGTYCAVLGVKTKGGANE